MAIKSSCYLSLMMIALTGYMTGCKTVSMAETIPAVILTHTDASIAELRSTVIQALNGTQVTIAKSAFNSSNRLILERKTAIGPDGMSIQTRVDEKPIIFELYLIEDNCYLIDLRDNKQYHLKQASCSKLQK